LQNPRGDRRFRFQDMGAEMPQNQWQRSPDLKRHFNSEAERNAFFADYREAPEHVGEAKQFANSLAKV
jgi:hypothetical protein